MDDHTIVTVTDIVGF